MSNASSFKYQVLPLGNHVKTIVFQASAPADLRVVLGSSEKFDDDEAVSYHLVMGGEDNMYSWISKQMNGKISKNLTGNYVLWDCNPHFVSFYRLDRFVGDQD